MVLVKGAPEEVIAMCTMERTADGDAPLDREASLEAARNLAATGRRVLAFAAGYGAEAARAAKAGEPRGLALLGLVGMLDPPRSAAREAVARCKRAGIRVIMVTGDHAATATVVADMVGLADSGGRVGVCGGRDLEGMSDKQLDEVLGEVSVFARSSPAQKLRIVERLRAAGEVVAVTGDGVNDAPALKSADIGAAMGLTGTAVAREASEMVLTDDNFATVYAAVEEGRTAFSNIRKASFYLISSGAAELLAILGSLAAGSALPFRPAQILWLNVVTNGIQDVALALEPPEQHLFERPPRRRREGLLTRVLVERTLLVGLVMAAGTLAVFALEMSEGASLAYAQVAALTMMVVFQIVHVGNCRSETLSIFRRSPVSNPFLLVGSVAALAVHVGAMYAPPTQALLNLEPLDLSSWLRIGIFALAVVVVVELHKRVRREEVPEAQAVSS
jgi:Ca2+-transporting ATPase